MSLSRFRNKYGFCNNSRERIIKKSKLKHNFINIEHTFFVVDKLVHGKLLKSESLWGTFKIRFEYIFIFKNFLNI